MGSAFKQAGSSNIFSYAMMEHPNNEIKYLAQLLE